MNDTDVLDLLVKRHELEKHAAKALGVSPQQFNNWRRRGIPPAMRPVVWKAARKAGAKLPAPGRKAAKQGLFRAGRGTSAVRHPLNRRRDHRRDAGRGGRPRHSSLLGPVED